MTTIQAFSIISLLFQTNAVDRRPGLLVGRYQNVYTNPSALFFPQRWWNILLKLNKIFGFVMFTGHLFFFDQDNAHVFITCLAFNTTRKLYAYPLNIYFTTLWIMLYVKGFGLKQVILWRDQSFKVQSNKNSGEKTDTT